MRNVNRFIILHVYCLFQQIKPIHNLVNLLWGHVHDVVNQFLLFVHNNYPFFAWGCSVGGAALLFCRFGQQLENQIKQCYVLAFFQMVVDGLNIFFFQ